MGQRPVIVTITDMRAANLCSGGGRRMAAACGLSWNHFVTHGYPADVLAAINDPLLNRMIAEAYKRVGQS